MIGRAQFLGLLAATFLAGAAQAQTWRPYHNARFGTSADVPAGWAMAPPPENGDGASFSSPDKSATLVVSGIFSVLPRAEEFAERLKPDSGEAIAYHSQGSDWIVVSGTHGDRIFYRKSLLSCGIWNDLSIEYPAAEKTGYDALVVHVAASLKAGRGEDSVPCP